MPISGARDGVPAGRGEGGAQASEPARERRLSKFSGSDDPPFAEDTISRPPNASKARLAFRPLAAIEALPPPSWLLTRYVPEDALMMVYGAPNSFKSFLALDWAMTISKGKSWLGARVPEARRCCYIMGEGLRGLRQRTDAWKRVRGTPGDIHFLERPVSLLEGGSVKALERELRRLRPAFLVIDTVARNFGNGDENSTRDMSAFVTACDALRASVPAMTLCLVHHSGWSEEQAHRPRGSIALHAATDLEYLCIRKKFEMTLRQPRTKDGEEMEDEHFVAIKTAGSLVLERLDGVDHRTRTKRALDREADVARAERVKKRLPRDGHDPT